VLTAPSVQSPFYGEGVVVPRAVLLGSITQAEAHVKNC
jgi:hypothetical protein